jgi:hypothetical protein
MASGSDTYAQELDKTVSSDNAGSSSTPKDISVLVPYVDLITRMGQRNRRAQHKRPPSPIIDVSPFKLQKDVSLWEKLSSKVQKFYSQVAINTESS